MSEKTLSKMDGWEKTWEIITVVGGLAILALMVVPAFWGSSLFSVGGFGGLCPPNPPGFFALGPSGRRADGSTRTRGFRNILPQNVLCLIERPANLVLWTGFPVGVGGSTTPSAWVTHAKQRGGDFGLSPPPCTRKTGMEMRGRECPPPLKYPKIGGVAANGAVNPLNNYRGEKAHEYV